MSTEPLRTLTPEVCVLFLGDSVDIPAIRAEVEALPDDAYGQVFVEVATRVQVQRWSTPPGVGVTWLERYDSSGGRGPVVPRGELAARALAGWVSEWMPDSGRRAVPSVGGMRAQSACVPPVPRPAPASDGASGRSATTRVIRGSREKK